jgi:hypothetical protein
MSKKTLSARISEKTENDLTDYSNQMDISKSEATNRLLDKALEIEQGDADIIIADGSGDTRDRLGDLANQIQELDGERSYELPVLTLGIIYIVCYVVFDMSVQLSLFLGFPMIAGLLYINYKGLTQ